MAELSTDSSSDFYELGIKLESIFMPYARQKRDKLYSAPNGPKPFAKFVHYTSADAALKILKTKRVWMRNTTCMIDYREVQHGYDLLINSFNAEGTRKRFCEALDAISEGVATETMKLFDGWWSTIRSHTFITSISEHDDEEEDLHGRLSMWRAYGGTSGRVAIVLRLPRYSKALEALNAIFSPVAYLPERTADQLWRNVTDNIRENHLFLSTVEPQLLTAFVFNMFVAAVTCLKHEGFKEEREWRVIYTPKMMSSPHIKAHIAVVGGVAQTIQELPLDEKVSNDLADVELGRLFDRLIVGPSQFAEAMCEAFVTALGEIGIEAPEKRVIKSEIPIRS